MHLLINIVVLVLIVLGVLIWFVLKRRRSKESDDRITRNVTAHLRNLLAEGVLTGDEVRKNLDDLIEDGNVRREERDDLLRQILGR